MGRTGRNRAIIRSKKKHTQAKRALVPVRVSSRVQMVLRNLLLGAFCAQQASCWTVMQVLPSWGKLHVFCSHLSFFFPLSFSPLFSQPTAPPFSSCARCSKRCLRVTTAVNYVRHPFHPNRKVSTIICSILLFAKGRRLAKQLPWRQHWTLGCKQRQCVC